MTATILRFCHAPMLPPMNPKLRFVVEMVPELVEAFGSRGACYYLRMSLATLRLRAIEARWSPFYIGGIPAVDIEEAASWLERRIGELEG